MTSASSRIGVVVIGRNEGGRLGASLQSIRVSDVKSVYVDSASTDNSVDLASKCGFDVVALDASLPPNAALARNAGFAHLMSAALPPDFVQFVDGDTELHPDWIQSGLRDFDGHPRLAVVAGVLTEKNAHRSYTRRLFQIEWARKAGPTPTVGGIMLVRASAFQDVDGFCGDMLAGEEAEFCRRLRSRGWEILQSGAAMGTHDSGVDRVIVWLRRAARGGYAYAHAVWLHPRDKGKRRKVLSALLYGLALPAAGVTLTVLGCLGSRAAWLAAATTLVPFLAVWVRTFTSMRRRGFDASDATLYAHFCLLAKPCEAYGVVKFMVCKIFGLQPRWAHEKESASLGDDASRSVPPAIG